MPKTSGQTFTTDDDLARLTPEDGEEFTYVDPTEPRMTLLKVRITRAKGYTHGQKRFRLRWGGKPPHVIKGVYISGAEFRARKKDDQDVTGRVTLTMARAEALRVFIALTNGDDPYPEKTNPEPKPKALSAAVPVDHKADAPKAISGRIDDAVAEYLDEYRQGIVDVSESSATPPKRNNRLCLETADGERGVFNNHILPWFKKEKLILYRDIESGYITNLLKDVAASKTVPSVHQKRRGARIKGGYGAARNVGIALQQFFDWLKSRGKSWLVENPMDSIDLDALLPVPGIKTCMLESEDEIRAVWTAALEDGYPAGAAYMFGLLTDQRFCEVIKLPKAELDKPNAVWNQTGWHDPKAEGEIGNNKLDEAGRAELMKRRRSRRRNKSRRFHRVPLSSLALELLDRLPPHPGDYVFTYGGNKPCSEGNGTVWKKRIDKRAAEILGRPLPDWDYHSFRRLFASKMPELLPGSEAAVDRHQNHYMSQSGGERLSKAAPNYNQNVSAYDAQKRTVSDKWDEYIRGLIFPEPLFPDFLALRPEAKFRLPVHLQAEAVRLRDEEGITSPTVIARKLGVKVGTIRYTLAHQSSMPLLNPNTKPPMTAEQEAKAQRLYLGIETGVKIPSAKIAQLMGFSHSRIKRAVRKANPSAADRPPVTYRESDLPQEVVERMVRMRLTERKEFLEIAKIEELPKSTVEWAIKKALGIPRTRRRKIGPHELAKAASLHLDDSEPVPKVMEITGLSRSRVYRAIREEKERRQPSLPLGEAAD